MRAAPFRFVSFRLIKRNANGECENRVGPVWQWNRSQRRRRCDDGFVGSTVNNSFVKHILNLFTSCTLAHNQYLTLINNSKCMSSEQGTFECISIVLRSVVFVSVRLSSRPRPTTTVSRSPDGKLILCARCGERPKGAEGDGRGGGQMKK